MIVECGHCGAPLDIEEGRSVVTCAYCTKKNHVAKLKQLAPVTPPDFAAPPVWRPPSTAAADSVEELTFHPPRKSSKVAIVAGFLSVIGVIGGIIVWSQTRGATIEQVAQEPLDRTMDQIAQDLHVTYRTERAVRVTFRSGAAGPYEHVWYRYDDEDKSLPRIIALDVVEGSTIGPKVIPSLTKHLRGGLDQDGRWSWGPVSIGVDRKTGSLTLDVERTVGGRPNPDRRRQLELGWQMIRTAAFGGPDVPASELLALFGAGHPIKRIGAIDPTIPFGRAREEIPRTFPGALADESGYQIAVDHPLIASVGLSWHNAADGYLHGTHFKVTAEYPTRRKQWMACVAKEAGPPLEEVEDFAKGTKRYAFTVRGSDMLGSRVTLHLDEGTSLYLASLGTRFDRDAWVRAFAILDRCR